jgi:hypothetical protein
LGTWAFFYTIPPQPESRTLSHVKVFTQKKEYLELFLKPPFKIATSDNAA